LLKRYAQLKDWTDAVKTPDCLWISGLFNPMSFLTAIMQKTARAQTLPLDFIILKTDVMNFDRSEIKEKPEDGAYIDGFFLDGANWEKGRGGEQGYLCEQTLKELNPELPVMHVTAVTKDKRPKIGYYNCPMYVTKTRGPTLVYRADIKMESDESQQYKWILAGVALVMNAD
jgi:dynein heavy chain